MTKRPRCVILAGPNGAGKSTHASGLVLGVYGIATYINADVIASGFGEPTAAAVAFDAGRLAIGAADECIARRVDFAFETTLSGRRWPRLLDRLSDAGYEVLLHYLWIPDASQCVARVAQRVATGGHPVREVDIRRRHQSSLDNLRTIFMPRVQLWHLSNAAASGSLRPVASGRLGRDAIVVDPLLWALFEHALRRDVVRETPTYDAPAWGAIIAESQIAVRRALAIQRALGVGAVISENRTLVMLSPHELPRDVHDVEWTHREIARGP